MNRRGVVWLCQDLDFGNRPRPVTGYWASSPGNDGQILEEADHGLGFDVEAALRWGRRRAPIVLIRLHRGGYYWAGEQPPEWDRRCPRWPGEVEARQACDARLEDT